MRKLLFSFIFLAIIMCITCINEYNPFEDTGNVQVLITRCSFQSADSIEIFSADTLNISLVLKHRIDSVVIKSETNRYWEKKVLRQNSGLAVSHELIFSFWDTGVTTIDIDAYCDNGTIRSQTLKTRAFSPLRQAPLISDFTSPVDLSTPPVDDRVTYNWEFDSGTIVSSTSPAYQTMVSPSGADTIGRLWVSDDSGNASPASLFSFMLLDTIGPVIRCLNPGYDSISNFVRTGDSSCFFKVYISDHDPLNSHKITVNNEYFDIIDDNIFMKDFDNIFLFTKQYPETVIVYAEDLKKNVSRDSFFLYFDTTMEQSNKTILLLDTILNVTSNPVYKISGKLIDKKNQPVKLSIIVSDSVQGDTLFKNGNGNWFWKVALKKDTINRFRIDAKDTNNNVLAQDSGIIYHDSKALDLTGPIIHLITVEGMNDSITPFFNPRIFVTTYDQVSYVTTVSIDNNPAVYTDTAKLTWSDTLRLIHGLNTIPIVSKDTSGCSTSVLLTVTQNTKPYFETFPDSTVINKYTDNNWTLDIIDNDADVSLSADIDTLIDGMELNNGVLRWKTTSSTITKTYRFEFTLSDGHQDTLIPWIVTVKDTTINSPPVQFKTKETNFPALLIADSNQLNVNLSIIDTTGQPPYKFTAVIQDLDTILLSNTTSGASSTLRWSPTSDDIGYHQLVITVTDGQLTSDTLLPCIQVIPKNQWNCSLSVACIDSPALLNLSNKTLNMRGVIDTLTLLYTIHDKDSLFTESYKVTKKIANSTDIFYPDSLVFSIDVLPKPKEYNKNDTLTVFVVDKTGKPDTVSLIVLYRVTFQPDDLDSLFYWFDATDAVTVLNKAGLPCAANDSVFCWKNRAAVNGNLDKTLKPPVYRTELVSTLRYNASAKTYLGSSDTLPWTNQAFAVFIVARTNLLTPGKNYHLLAANKDPYAFSIGIINGNPGYTFLNKSSPPILTYSATSLSVPLNKACLLTCDKSILGQFTVGLNGIHSPTGSLSLPKINNTLTGLNFTSQTETGWDGDLYEIVVYNRTLTQEQMRTVEIYLASKYGIQLSN